MTEKNNILSFILYNRIIKCQNVINNCNLRIRNLALNNMSYKSREDLYRQYNKEVRKKNSMISRVQMLNIELQKNKHFRNCSSRLRALEIIDNIEVQHGYLITNVDDKQFVRSLEYCSNCHQMVIKIDDKCSKCNHEFYNLNI